MLWADDKGTTAVYVVGTHLFDLSNLSLSTSPRFMPNKRHLFNNYSSESIAHEAEIRMGYWLRVHEGERNDCFSKIQLVGQKYRE